MSGLDALLAGHTLADRYRIGEVIGRGGFAVVYEAHDERLDRTVAVKVIMLSGPPGGVADEMRARFQREARASAGLQHPNVVGIYDFGTDANLGLDFLVMERLLGEDLRARLARPEPIPPHEAMHILSGAAAGVAAGHQVGIIHRDIKPANVFLAPRAGHPLPRVCVLDFGIALLAAADETRLTQHGIPLSVAYASPEQLAGTGELTPASDVFALGVVAYELLARQRPYSGDPLRAGAERLTAPRPLRELNPSVPERVAAAVHRALAVDPADRFPDAGAFAQALRGDASELPQPATPAPPAVAHTPGAGVAPGTPERRPRTLAAIGALLVVLVIGVAWALSRGGGHAKSAAPGPTRTAATAPAGAPAAPAAAVLDSPAQHRPATGRSAAAGATPRASSNATGRIATSTPAPAQPAPRRVAPPAPPPAPAIAPPPAAPPPQPRSRTASVPAPNGAEFRENLPHRCQALADAAALECLNRDLDAADRELNQVFRETMSRLDPGARHALLDSQRAWLQRYDAVLTSYYSRPWAGHSRVRVLPSQIQALRDRTAYLRRVGSR